METQTAKASALLPILFFIAIFVGVGSYFTSQGVDFAFYQLPAHIAILPAILLAVLMSSKKSNETISTFIKGAGHSNIITMCLIYLLAGAFSVIAKSTGGVNAVVDLGLAIIPSWFLLPGIFIISALIATAMGTSMGTIAAVAPVAFGIGETAQIDGAVMAGAVFSGAIFGDNLSIISDTTIAATRTQGCRMKDKFAQNIKISLPAALITIVLLTWFNNPGEMTNSMPENPLLALPYLVILVLAVSGVNVFAVLTAGILLAGISGLITGEHSLLTLSKNIGEGFVSMQEIFILSLLIGGLSEITRAEGGLIAIQKSIGKLIAKAKNSHVAAQFGISMTTALTNIGVANNTVAILITGDLNREMAQKHGIKAAKAASLVDIAACIVQGLIPWGAQALLLGSLFALNPVSVVTTSIYPVALTFTAGIAMLLKK
ncbi:Na+/H+ antiporter NhaC family protein [Thalassotalea aquiviva]|uniref:Na+/H+ antiporter NhaC family protein n=1 Tax=Thalassotalea aquiviva TaxID=3242415 RepID=UPI00352B55E9